MKISEKLIERLRNEFSDFNENIPITEKSRRLYHGHHQRSIGAWSWCIGGNSNCLPCYGSQWNMKELLKFKYLSLFIENSHEISIIPEEKYYEIPKVKF